MPSYLRSILVAGIAVALGCAAVWFFHRNSISEPGPSDGSNGSKGKIAAKPLKKKNGASKGGTVGSASGEATHGVYGKEREAKPEALEEAADAEANTNNVAENTKPTRRFANPMDQLLAMVAPREVGDPVPPVPVNEGVEFTPEQESQMFEQLSVEDGDTEEAIAHKEIVQAMRDEYAELKKKRGWTFVDYIKALEAKFQLDNEVLVESAKIHDTAFNDPDISDEKYLEILEKVNKVLGERGIKPITPPTEEAIETNTNPDPGDTK